MQGLQLLVRLMHHHPDTVHTQLHSVIVAVAKQVRNLRSQVARAACQASGELFLSQKKAVETVSDSWFLWSREVAVGSAVIAEYAQVSLYSRVKFLKKSRKWNTELPFQTMYFLGFTGLISLS